MSKAGLPVKKPISTWNKPLKADWKALFKALAKGAKDGALGKWEELPGAGVDLLSSIGLETSAGERAYLLIRRALTAAIHELVGEAVAQHTLVLGGEENLVDRFDWSLEESDLLIDRRFFDRPAALPIVEHLKLPLWELLVMFTLEPARATTVSNRLATYFTFHLAQEWRQNPVTYGPLREALDGPFAAAAEREQGWALYDAWLQKQAEAPVFGATFSIKNIYIPLRAYWEAGEGGATEESTSSEAETSEDDKEETASPENEKKPKPTRVAVHLHEEILTWLDQPSPSFTTRLLSGGPGSGKSTFARMLAAEVSCTGSWKVLYVPLHLFDVTGDLLISVDHFVARDRFLTANPLDPKNGESHLLLIFDGLDELASQGTVGAEVAAAFAGEVRVTIERLNDQNRDIRALITGRPVAVDLQRTHFRRPEQLLFVLPYETPDRERRLYFNPSILEEDQRTHWWQQYGRFMSQNYEGVPATLDRSDLAEITRQPLLNYLLALSYERGKLDFTHETSLNEIYSDLLDAVYDRQWGPGGPHPAVGDLEKEDFERILEEIAVATWHGNGRTASISAIEDRLTSLGLLPLLARVSEGAEKGIGRLLLAFYFRRAGRSERGDPTFEFTHKSFGEYLVARRIVGVAETIHSQLRERERSYDSGWDEGIALERWVGLTGPTELEVNLLEFLRREVALQARDLVLAWQTMSSRLLSRQLLNGLPMERIKPALTYQQMTRWARNAEETLLSFLNSTARVSKCRSTVAWPSNTSFGELLNRLRGQRTVRYSLALRCISWLDLEGATLHMADLYGSDLEGCSLRMSAGYSVQLAHSNLRSADLQGADFRRGDFSYANLEGANLSASSVSEASFRGANLRGATLEQADFRGADLMEADLHRAKFKRASIGGGIFKGSDYYL